MPINSIRCGSCGGRINYVVDAAVEAQDVICKRCGNVNQVSAKLLPEKVQEELAELEKQDDALERADALVAQMEGRDSVEESLERVDATFAAARDMLSGIEQSLGMSANITEIANEYKISDIPEVGETAGAPRTGEGGQASPGDSAPSVGDAALRSLNMNQQTETLRFIERAYLACNEQGFDPQTIFANERNIEALSASMGMDRQTTDIIKEVIGSKGFGYLAEKLLSKR